MYLTVDEFKKIIIVEDNEEVSGGLRFLIDFSEQYKVVGTFDRCETTLEAIPDLKPDIILMDIDLPGMNGIEGTKLIKGKYPLIEILIVTVFENSGRVFDALCAGASGYITKNSGTKLIIEAIDEMVKGGAPMSANIARMVVQSFNKPTKPQLLTARELEILQLLSKGKSYKSISNLLQISLGTVKFHLKNIYIKMQVSNREDAIDIALKNKWV